VQPLSIQSREQLRGATRESVKAITTRGQNLGSKLKEYRATMKELRKGQFRAKRAARVPLPEPGPDEWEQEMEEIYVSAMGDL